MIFTLPEIGLDLAKPNSGDSRITGNPVGVSPGCNSPLPGVSSQLDCPGFGPGSFGEGSA